MSFLILFQHRVNRPKPPSALAPVQYEMTWTEVHGCAVQRAAVTPGPTSYMNQKFWNCPGFLPQFSVPERPHQQLSLLVKALWPSVCTRRQEDLPRATQ